MSKNTKLETVALEDLATITGGVFGSGPAQPDPWNDAMRSGKLSGPGSTLDVIQRNAGRPSWRWR